MKNNGMLIESAALLARVQTCAKRVQSLQEEGHEAGAVALGNAVESVMSAMIARNLINQFMVLPECIRKFHEVVVENS